MSAPEKGHDDKLSINEQEVDEILAELEKYQKTKLRPVVAPPQSFSAGVSDAIPPKQENDTSVVDASRTADDPEEAGNTTLTSGIGAAAALDSYLSSSGGLRGPPAMERRIKVGNPRSPMSVLRAARAHEAEEASRALAAARAAIQARDSAQASARAWQREAAALEVRASRAEQALSRLEREVSDLRAAPAVPDTSAIVNRVQADAVHRLHASHEVLERVRMDARAREAALQRELREQKQRLEALRQELALRDASASRSSSTVAEGKEDENDVLVEREKEEARQKILEDQKAEWTAKYRELEQREQLQAQRLHELEAREQQWRDRVDTAEHELRQVRQQLQETTQSVQTQSQHFQQLQQATETEAERRVAAAWDEAQQRIREERHLRKLAEKRALQAEGNIAKIAALAEATHKADAERIRNAQQDIEKANEKRYAAASEAARWRAKLRKHLQKPTPPPPPPPQNISSAASPLSHHHHPSSSSSSSSTAQYVVEQQPPQNYFVGQQPPREIPRPQNYLVGQQPPRDIPRAQQYVVRQPPQEIPRGTVPVVGSSRDMVSVVQAPWSLQGGSAPPGPKRSAPRSPPPRVRGSMHGFAVEESLPPASSSSPPQKVLLSGGGHLAPTSSPSPPQKVLLSGGSRLAPTSSPSSSPPKKSSSSRPTSESIDESLPPGSPPHTPAGGGMAAVAAMGNAPVLLRQLLEAGLGSQARSRTEAPEDTQRKVEEAARLDLVDEDAWEEQETRRQNEEAMETLRLDEDDDDEEEEEQLPENRFLAGGEEEEEVQEEQLPENHFLAGDEEEEEEEQLPENADISAWNTGSPSRTRVVQRRLPSTPSPMRRMRELVAVSEQYQKDSKRPREEEATTLRQRSFDGSSLALSVSSLSSDNIEDEEDDGDDLQSPHNREAWEALPPSTDRETSHEPSSSPKRWILRGTEPKMSSSSQRPPRIQPQEPVAQERKPATIPSPMRRRLGVNNTTTTQNTEPKQPKKRVRRVRRTRK